MNMHPKARKRSLRKKSISVYWLLVGALLLAASLGCTDLSLARSDPAAAEPEETLVVPDDFIQEILSSVSQERIVSDLKALTGETPLCTGGACYTVQNRLTGSAGLGHAKDYVVQELSSLGYSVTRQDWSMEGFSDQNILARKTGTRYPNELIYLVAHLDGVKTTSDERFPSADDDGSGVVDLLELGRALNPYSFERTLVLFFSTGEEQGVLGVRSHVNALSTSELSAIKYVVTIDMVGYDLNDDGAMQLWSGDHAPSLTFAQQLSDLIQAYPLDLAPQVVSGCTWGDERPFREKGITAAVQIQKYNGEQNELNPYNHTAQDSFAHINTGYLFEQTKATTAIAAELLVPNRLENRVFMPVALRRRN